MSAMKIIPTELESIALLDKTDIIAPRKVKSVAANKRVGQRTAHEKSQIESSRLNEKSFFFPVIFQIFNLFSLFTKLSRYVL